MTADRAAINAALGKSFAQLATGRPLAIPVAVVDVAGALEEVRRIGLETVASGPAEVTILANGARAPVNVPVETEVLPTAGARPATEVLRAPVNARVETEVLPAPAGEALRRARGLPLWPEEIRPAPPWRPF